MLRPATLCNFFMYPAFVTLIGLGLRRTLVRSAHYAATQVIFFQSFATKLPIVPVSMGSFVTQVPIVCKNIGKRATKLPIIGVTIGSFEEKLPMVSATIGNFVPILPKLQGTIGNFVPILPILQGTIGSFDATFRKLLRTELKVQECDATYDAMKYYCRVNTKKNTFLNTRFTKVHSIKF